MPRPLALRGASETDLFQDYLPGPPPHVSKQTLLSALDSDGVHRSNVPCVPRFAKPGGKCRSGEPRPAGVLTSAGALPAALHVGTGGPRPWRASERWERLLLTPNLRLPERSQALPIISSFSRCERRTVTLSHAGDKPKRAPPTTAQGAARGWTGPWREWGGEAACAVPGRGCAGWGAP